METFYTYATDPGSGTALTVGSGWHVFVEAGNPYFMSTRQFNDSTWGCQCWVDAYDGDDSQIVFTPNWYESYTAGVYQQVSGVTPGMAYSFSGRVATNGAFVQAARKVGIDPFGGTDPTSPNIVWGNESWATSSSHYQNKYTSAVAQNATVTVFVRIYNPGGGVPLGESFIDAFVLDTAPVAHVNALPAFQTSPNFMVSWTLDSTPPGASTFDGYDVQVREGSGTWMDWQNKNLGTSAGYAGSDCRTYYFQALAWVKHPADRGGEVHERMPGIYPGGDGQAHTTVLAVIPSSSVSALGVYQPDRFTVSWTGSPGSCGVAGYDIQVRDGPSGAWSDWLIGTGATSASFTGQDGHAYYFRSRAAGVGGYYEPYPSNADALTIVDALAPTVTIGSLPLVEVTTTIPLTWTAVDTASGVASYDVHTRSLRLADGLDSGWRPWISATVATQAQFSATGGTRFDFRVTARDTVGNLGAAMAGTNVLLTPAPVLVTSDLAASTLLPRPAEPVTFTVSLSNTGNLSATAGMALSLPAGIGEVISASVTASLGAPDWDGATVTWIGPLDAGAGAVVTAAMLVSNTTPLGTRASAQAVITDGVNLPITRTLALLVPYQVYLPVALRQ
jgi:uncharacterized repeat protein (TIGR01451 family)